MDFGLLLNESFNEQSRRANRLSFAYGKSGFLSAGESFATAVSNATMLAAYTESRHQHPFADAQQPVAGMRGKEKTVVSFHSDIMKDSSTC